MEMDLDLIGCGGNPYERFRDGIRDSETGRKYLTYSKRFLAWAGRACGASGRGASPSQSRTPVAAWGAWRARQPACGGTGPAPDAGGRACARSLRH